MRGSTFDAVNAELSQWLDPIACLDQRAEILRAAVSIYVERGVPSAPAVGGVLVTAWVQTQNVSDAHRRDLAVLAASLSDALLDAVQQSNDRTHASARLWAVNALRAIDQQHASARDHSRKGSRVELPGFPWHRNPSNER